MRIHFSKASIRAILVPTILFCMVGCGPTFFSSKGTVTSSGGELGHWSISPVMCMREEFDGDSSKLINLLFSGPKNTDPDRNVHGSQQPDGPYELHVAKNGSGYMAQMKFFKNIPGVDVFQCLILDSSNCKTFTLDRTEHSGFGSVHPTLNGELLIEPRQGSFLPKTRTGTNSRIQESTFQMPSPSNAERSPAARIRPNTSGQR